MRDILYPESRLSDPSPIKRAQNAMARHALPKRFYSAVTVAALDGGLHGVLLDGRPARSPGRNLLGLRTRAAAALLAAEWRAQADVVNPALMPATRIVNSGLDGVARQMAAVREEIARFAGSDLVCYRAGEPEGLVAAQNLHWNPVVDWAERTLDARFLLAEGVMHQQQAPQALAGVQARVDLHDDPVAVAALHVMTTISGSCLIALMAADGALDPEAAWAAATVDEAWNASLWGWDEEAERRLADRRGDFMAAHGLFRALVRP